MKNIIIIWVIVTLTISSVYSQTKINSKYSKRPIDLPTVDRIEVRKYLYQTDSLNVNWKILTDEEIKLTVDRWNNSKPKGLCKYMPKYWLYIHFKDGTKRTFRLNGRSIKENGDYCYDFGDTKFIEQILKPIK
jgi:hypothetical protein